MSMSGWLLGVAAIGACAGCGGVTERRLGGASDPPASCGLKSEFADDEACLPEMDPASGFSLHFGPGDHDHPGDFVVEPGNEVHECRVVALAHEPLFVTRWVASSRSSVLGFAILAAPLGIDPCEAHGARLLAVSETGKLDVTLGAAPENAGAALMIAPDEQIALHVHAINASSEGHLLREVWVNADTKPQSEVGLLVDTLALIATHAGEAAAFGGTATVSSERALLALSGHLHTRVETLEVFRVRGTERSFLYRQQGFRTHFLRYDSVSNNPVHDGYPDGASGPSGPVLLAPGDGIEWTCRGAPRESLTLPESTGVCVLRGWYAPSAGHWLHEP
jgi:hypothetical protein